MKSSSNMNVNGNKKILKNEDSSILPIFTGDLSLAEMIRVLGELLSSRLNIRYMAIGCMSDFVDKNFKDFVYWDKNGEPQHTLQSKLSGRVQLLVNALNETEYLNSLSVKALLDLTDNDRQYNVFAMRYNKSVIGFLFVDDLDLHYNSDYTKQLHDLSVVLGAPIGARMSTASEKLSSYVFNAMLDGMKASIYITDIDTGEILFMNQTMRKEYGLDSPEGNICWKLLQRGMTEQCPFCPIAKLKEISDPQFVYQWDEISSVTGKSYQNYDSLIHWIDGRIVHLQQSIDVTELKSANTDELTRLLSRRPGKKALDVTIHLVKRDGITATVCLYDINMMKTINEKYGHVIGDQLISYITTIIKNSFEDGEYAYRLNSDEFVAVFNTGLKSTQQRVEQILSELNEYEIENYGFSYGLVELTPNQVTTVEDVLFIADEKMYEQKRRFHVKYSDKKREELMYKSSKSNEEFDFDESLLYDAIVQSTENYIFVCNMKTGVFKFSRAMKDDFALPSEVVTDAIEVWGAKVHDEDRKTFVDAFQILADGRTTNHCVEYRVKNSKNQWVWVRCRGHLEYDKNGEAALFAGFVMNLDKKNQIDSLTGLYNKIVFKEQIQYLIDNEETDKFGMMIVGIDDLKHINDLYDRTFGDEVIKIVSMRVLTRLPHTATVYRLDGDEFGIIVRTGDISDMKRIYENINQSFKYQQEHEAKKYYCSLSAGIVQYPKDGTTYLDLLKHAGYSLEYSKTHGKKCCTIFSDEILGLRSRSLGMVEALRESVENDYTGFSIMYQPLVDASTGELFGIEALLRWEHMDFGKVSPIEFIPLLEQTGLIEQVGKWVLEESITTCKKWLDINPNIILDVNLSYRQLSNNTFISFVKEVLEKSKYPAKNLVLELTESHFVNDNEYVQKVFCDIRSLGVKVAMDDFGTGYSSLGILKESPADIVKIDKTFVRDIRASHFDSTFIQFVVVLCHDVGIKVCLEGVETLEQYDVVKSMNLDFIQGFLFDKPLTVTEFNQKYMSECI